MSDMQTVDDLIDPARIAALNATLGRDGDDAAPFAHQVFFWNARPEEELGRDGHPAIGRSDGLIPDLGFPRRMWAAGDLTFHAALQPREPAQCRSQCVSADRKTGRSGPLGLVRLEHRISQGDVLRITDRQTLVYLPDGPVERGAPQMAPRDEAHCLKRSFSTTQLFRYSALTFNGHRIHYDRDYARDVEGYPGLVVHGPLLAQYLMLLAVDLLGDLNAFQFRATAPLFDFESAEFCAKPSASGLDLWVRGPDGRECMTASAQ